MADVKRKRKPNRYRQFSKRARHDALNKGDTGLLITCNKRERECLIEAYNLLETYLPAVRAEEADAGEKEGQADSAKGQDDPVESQGDPVESQGDPVKSQGDPVKSQGDPAKSQGDPAKSQGDPAKSQGDPVESQGDPAKSQGDLAKSQGDPVESQGDPAKSQGDPAKSREVKTKPKAAPVVSSDDDDDDEDDDGDILRSLEKEKAATSASAREFCQRRTQVSNCVFVRLRRSPRWLFSITDRVFRDAFVRPMSRHILRLLPVEATSSCELDELADTFSDLWRRFLKDGGVDSFGDAPAFTVHFKARNYDRLDRGDVISRLYQAVKEASPNWNVNHDAADVVIDVNVLQKVACLSLLRQFKEFRKYNLSQVTHEGRS